MNESAAAPVEKAGVSDQDHVAAYLASLDTQRQLSPHTIAGYRRDLAELGCLIAAMPQPASHATLTHNQVRGFAARLHGRGLNARSIARMISAWRGYFKWLSKIIALPANPVDGVKAPKRSRPLPKALSVDDAQRAVTPSPAASGHPDPVQLCEMAMFELLYSSGLRVSELVGLDVHYAAGSNAQGHVSAGWIDLESAEVAVTGKGNKLRHVPVGTKAVEALQRWLAVRPALATGVDPGDRHALFVNKRGRRMAVRMVQQRLKAHGQATGIPVSLHPHMLRHSFATHVLQSSGDLRAVQDMLGHASITSTQIYTSLDFMHLARVYDAAHPRAKKKPGKDD